MTYSSEPKKHRAQIASSTEERRRVGKMTMPLPELHVPPHLAQHLADQDDSPAEEATVIARVEDLRQQLEEKKDRICLLVISGHLTGQMFRVEQRCVHLGRSSECEISLRDNDISRIHARIEQRDTDTFLLEDLGSTNGTFVNGRRVKSYLLQDNDRIQLGRSTILKFSLHDELEELFQRRLYESAVLDGLTQVYNRKFFDERLQTEFSFAQRHKTPLSLLLMDIDHFKHLNDTHGHPAGDQALRMVAQTIQMALRKEDIVARYGGEEFAVVARGILPTQAAILAERIRMKVEELRIPIETAVLQITLSIGAVTLYTQAFHSPEELLQEADERLYHAKRSGRNQVVAERIESW
ncbi:GGDEF domain-containing protein [Myxococcota bacterium]|nr:GGDEF domain-containing protein [Myxococcota bacterium]